MLHSRVKLILDYVKACESGDAVISHEALRLAWSLVHRLPALKLERFQGEFYEVIRIDGKINF